MKTFLCLALITGLFSCNQNSGNEDKNANHDQESMNDSNSMENLNSIVVKSGGATIAKVSATPSEIWFSLRGKEYQSKLKGDKRKYAVKKGEITYEVKYKDDAFKVRTASGDLLWKIKLYDDKVKISNNEENLNSYEIKKSNPDKYKLKNDENTLGEIELKKSDRKVEIGSQNSHFEIETERIYLGYGALLIDEIPEDIRIIIMAELIAKDK